MLGETRSNTIPLYPLKPGDQGEGIYCFQLKPNVEKDNIEYQGIELELRVNSRDAKAGNYWIEYMEGTDEMTLYKPLFDKPYEEDQAIHDARQSDSRVKKGHNAARSAYSKLPSEQKTLKFVLKLPPGWKLTQKPLGHAVAEDEIVTAKDELITYKYETQHVDTASKPIYEIISRITWKFCNLTGASDENVNSKGGKDAVAASFAGM